MILTRCLAYIDIDLASVYAKVSNHNQKEDLKRIFTFKNRPRPYFLTTAGKFIFFLQLSP
jgi:hypothetical protein